MCFNFKIPLDRKCTVMSNDVLYSIYNEPYNLRYE